MTTSRDSDATSSRKMHAQAKHVKLEDVAAEARVSLSTASRALRGHPAVHQSTRRRVLDAATRLGYEPNRMASALRMRTSPFIGVVVPDITIPFYALAVKAAQEVFERADYQVLVMSTDRHAETERKALRTLLSHRARGVLLATSSGFESAVRIPVVFFADFEPTVAAPRVALSNREGIRLLVEHLVWHGHERIAYVGGPPLTTPGRERLASFEESMSRTGMSDKMIVRLADDAWSPTSAAQAAMEALSESPPPTAILAGGDTLALGALKTLRTQALRVPDDVAVVSFQDPDRVGGLIEPPLTSLAPRERELGQHAAGLLLHVLDVSQDPSSATEIRLPATLIVRRSCGCNPA